MAAKSKVKIRPPNALSYSFILFSFASICATIYYIGCKISHLYKHSTNSGYFSSVDTIKSLVGIEHEDAVPSFTVVTFYTTIGSLIVEDIGYLLDCLYSISVSLIESAKVHLSTSYASPVVVFTTALVLCLSTVIYAQSHRSDKKPQKKNNSKKEKIGQPKNGACCHDDKSSTKVIMKRVWWRWLMALVALSFLLSLPWEFVRLYQSMVAESVAQMKTGIPVECMPDQMSLTQTVRAWLRWQFSWGQDPCLLYHKALLVDPIWQVPPLMVLSSAFSHCIVYPIEVLFGGLGRAFRLFFAEIPTQWQPIMLVVMVTILVLVLTMMFGYRIHLPFLKFEPKTPMIIKLKQKRPVVDEKKMQNFSDELTSSQESDYSLYTGTQSSQSQSDDY